MNHPNQTDLERIRQTERRRALVRKALTYTALVLWALMVLFPFYWMLLTSVKSYGSYNAEHIPALFTLSPTLENYKAAFTAVPLGRYLLNTLVFTVLTTAIMAVGQHLELQDAPNAYDDLLHARIELLEDLDGSLLGDLADALDKLLSLHGIHLAHPGEMLGSKGGDPLKLEFSAGSA